MRNVISVLFTPERCGWCGKQLNLGGGRHGWCSIECQVAHRNGAYVSYSSKGTESRWEIPDAH